MQRNLRLTRRQLNIIKTIGKLNPDGSSLDLDQIIENVNYEVTKPALQFSLRFLRQGGVIEKLGIEKRRGAKRVIYGLTPFGKRIHETRILTSNVYRDLDVVDFDVDTDLSATIGEIS